MKTDFYTKAVLTVIAVSLLLLVLQNMDMTKAIASYPSAFATLPVNEDGSVNVRFPETMKVNLAEIGGSSIYGNLPVNIKEFSGSSLNSTGLPVNIKAVDGSSVYSSGLPVNIKAVDGSSVYGGIPVKMKN